MKLETSRLLHVNVDEEHHLWQDSPSAAARRCISFLPSLLSLLFMPWQVISSLLPLSFFKLETQVMVVKAMYLSAKVGTWNQPVEFSEYGSLFSCCYSANTTHKGVHTNFTAWAHTLISILSFLTAPT